MAATKLSLVNGALALLKTRKLTAAELAGNLREPARAANDAWDRDFVRGCLEEGNWRFAIRSRQLVADPGIDPAFDDGGYLYAFAKDTDWLRWAGVFSDADMKIPYDDYNDEAGYLFANVDTLYVRYVSDDASFGGDLSRWPRSFQQYVEAKLAFEIAGPLTQEAGDMQGLARDRLKDAQAKDVINEPTRQQPVSSWVRARFGSNIDRQRRAGSS